MSMKEYLDILKDLWTPTNASKIRMAIHDALVKAYEDVDSNIKRQSDVEKQFQDVLDETTDKDFNSAPEIKAARNGKPNLKTRIDDFENQTTAQLDQKANENEVQSNLNMKRDKSVPIGLNDAASDLLAAVQNKDGETTFNLLSKPRPNSVTPLETTFIKSSSNLFDMNNLEKGNIISGNYEPAETWLYTPKYEPIKPNTPYQLSFESGQARAWFYDESFNFITRIEATGTNQSVYTEGGENFAHVRFSAQRNTLIETMRFNEGTVPLPYEPYYKRLSEDILLPGMTTENEYWEVD